MILIGLLCAAALVAAVLVAVVALFNGQSEERPRPPIAPHANRNKWDADVCACGTQVVSCHGCAEPRCLRCDPYTDDERLNRCCTTWSVGRGYRGATSS